MSEIQKRRDALLYYVQESLTEYGAWAEGTERVILPDDPFDVALRAMFSVFMQGDIPGDLRDLTREVEKLQADYMGYQDRMEAMGQWDEAPPVGMGTTIGNITKLLTKVQQPKKPPLETIADFDRQKVSDRQIAVAYGWYLDNGRPDEARVRKQRADNPDLEIPNPHNAAIEEQQQRNQEAIERAIRKQREREEIANKPAPESIDELVEQKVGIKQIAEMKKMTVGEVERYCFDNGLEWPTGQSLEAAAAEVAQDAEDERREFLDHTPTNQPEDVDDSEPVSNLSLEEQIVEASQADMSHADIAEMLDISEEKVAAVLARQDEVVA